MKGGKWENWTHQKSSPVNVQSVYQSSTILHLVLGAVNTYWFSCLGEARRLNVFNSIIFLSLSCFFQPLCELHMPTTERNSQKWNYIIILPLSLNEPLNFEMMRKHATRACDAFLIALTLHRNAATCTRSHLSHCSLDGRFIFNSTGNLWAQMRPWKSSHRLTRHASTHQPASTGKYRQGGHLIKTSTCSPSPSSISNVAIHAIFKKICSCPPDCKREAGTSSKSLYIRVFGNQRDGFHLSARLCFTSSHAEWNLSTSLLFHGLISRQEDWLLPRSAAPSLSATSS